MPRKGYKCITVPERVHQEISRRANASNQTMIKYVEYLLERENASKRRNNFAFKSRTEK